MKYASVNGLALTLSRKGWGRHLLLTAVALLAACTNKLDQKLFDPAPAYRNDKWGQ